MAATVAIGSVRSTRARLPSDKEITEQGDRLRITDRVCSDRKLERDWVPPRSRVTPPGRGSRFPKCHPTSPGPFRRLTRPCQTDTTGPHFAATVGLSRRTSSYLDVQQRTPAEIAPTLPAAALLRR